MHSGGGKMLKALLTTSAAAAATLALIGTADAVTPFDWSGLYIGAHGGYLNGQVNLSEDDNGGGAISGSVWGFLAGYNFPQSPSPYVVGLEGDFGWANVSGNGLISCL